jgi:hypothetical protein
MYINIRGAPGDGQRKKWAAAVGDFRAAILEI